tara:strand:+ start:19665 stop:19958 length:294 start_codon:yes stop_codon:yes gene_type:complete
MKNTLLKIGAVLGAIFGVILLIFKSSNTTKLDKEIKSNKKELDDVADHIEEANKKKAKIKKKVAVSKKKVAKTKARKKDTTSAKAKAKNFKNKYKKK